jgi:hypothetical protein
MQSLLSVRRLLRGVRYDYLWQGWQIHDRQTGRWGYASPEVARRLLRGFGFHGQDFLTAWRKLRTTHAHRIPLRMSPPTRLAGDITLGNHVLDYGRRLLVAHWWEERTSKERELLATMTAAGRQQRYELSTRHSLPLGYFHEVP